MAAGEIVLATSPITVDADGVADTAVIQAFASALFPIATYPLVHIQIIPPTGTKTKAVLVVSAQSVA